MKRQPSDMAPEFSETTDQRRRFPEEEPQSEVNDEPDFEPRDDDDIDEDGEDEEDTEPDR